MFPKGVLQIVSKVRGNTLGRGNPEVSANLEIFKFEDPISSFDVDRDSDNSERFSSPSFRLV